VTSGSPTVTDTHILATDTGMSVLGVGIPPGTFVGTVTAGTSFLLSSSATSQVNVNATSAGNGTVVIGPPNAPDNDTHTLYDTSGTAFVAQNTAVTTGQIPTPVTNFNWADYAIAGNGGLLLTLPAGTYNVGIACVTNTATTDRFWNTQLTFVANAGDPNGETWTVAPATANTTSTWNTRAPNNGLFGGPGGRVLASACTTSASSTILATTFAATDLGRPIRGVGIGLGAIISGAAVRTNAGVTWTSGSTTITGSGFVAGDVGSQVTGGTGIPPCTTITATTATNATISNATTAAQATAVTVQLSNMTMSVPATATTTAGNPALGGNSWWQPGGATGNTGNLVVAYDLGSPRTVNSVTTSWGDGNFCPGGGVACTNFEGVNYQILTSPNGTQNSWTVCKTVTANAVTPTVDTCTAPATGAQYVEFDITSWNAPTFAPPSIGYGPIVNSILLQ
jgi:hypothetical protein